MNLDLNTDLSRRNFLRKTMQASVASGLLAGPHLPVRAEGNAVFRAGEAHVDSTPPKEIELAGFHYPVGGNPRYITDIRQETAVRALVMQQGTDQVAILSLDIAAVSEDMTKRVGQAVQSKTGIPAAHVRLCATHTHSMPTFAYWRQWGTIPEEYMKRVEAKAVEAVTLAQADCAEAALFVGTARAEGGNFNRTTKTWKTDADYGKDASDADRWLDTLLQVLYLERAGDKPGILWYHFASHPVCYNDGLAGPDWPGLVTQQVRDEFGLTPSFLQGHAGDVNPGDGAKWIGDAEQSAAAVIRAIGQAMSRMERIEPDRITCIAESFAMPLDLELHRQWLETYEAQPEACTSGVWVDAGFAKAWYEANHARSWKESTVDVPVSAVRIGSLALAFHPSELFSYYGLATRFQSPFEHVLLTGYTDGSIGYVTDPSAYEEGDRGIYAAVTVPKIIDLPPFTRDAGHQLTKGLTDLLHRLYA